MSAATFRNGKPAFDIDLARWMRAAGIPPGEIARSLGGSERAVGKYTAGDAPFDMQDVMRFEKILFFPLRNGIDRGRTIGRGRMMRNALQRRKATEGQLTLEV